MRSAVPLGIGAVGSWPGAPLCPCHLGGKARGWPRSRTRGQATAALADGEGRGDPGAGVRWDAEGSWAGSLGHVLLHWGVQVWW